MSPRLANRRIRLLLAFLALAFADRIRPRVLAAGRARAAARAARRAAAPRDDHHSRRPRDDLRPHGRAARDRRGGDHGLRRSAAGAQRAAGRGRGGPRAEHRSEQDLPAASRQEAELRLRPAEGRPRARGCARAAGWPGSTSTRRSGATTRSTRSRRRCSATPGSTTPASPDWNSVSTAPSRASPGKETVVRDPFGRTIDVVSSTPEQPGRDVFLTLDHTLQAKVESVLRDDGREVARDRRDGDRPRPVDRRRARDGERPRLRRERLPEVPSCLQRNRAVTDTYEPGSTFKVVTYAAALTEQRRHPESTFTLAAVDQRRRPDDRRGRAAADRDDVGRGDARPVVERRHDHARRSCSARSGSAHGSPIRLRADRQASTSPARAPGSSCRWTSGPARRSGTSRSARASPSRRSRWHRRTPRSRTRRVGRAAPRRPRAGTASRRRSTAGASSRPTIARELMGMLQGVVSGGHRRRGGGAGLPGRGEDRNRGEARLARRLLGHELRRLVRRDRSGERAPRWSSSSRSTSRRARSSAASSPRRHSATSPASRSSTWMSRRTTRRR